MIKVALTITIISITNPEKAPEISIAKFYDNMNKCYQQLDVLKNEVNADSIIDQNKNRVLRLENREYHHRNYIFWSCINTNFNK